MTGLRNIPNVRLLVGLMLLCAPEVGMTNPSHAATILSLDNRDERIISVTNIRNWGIGFPVSESAVSQTENAFSLVGVPFGEAYELAGTFYRLAPEIARVPSSTIDQNPNRLGLDLSQNLSSFGTTQMSPGTVLLQSRVPVKPISPLPSAAVLFGPALIGVLGVILRQVPSLKRPAAAISSSSQVGLAPPTNPALILILSPDATFAKQTEEQLHRSNHPIRVVPSVAEIFSIANHTPVSMVVVDPRASDWDMLRTDTALRHILMIALVPPGFVYTEEDCQAGLDRGIDGVHFTYEGPRLLLAKITAYLRRAGYEQSRRGIWRVGAVELDADSHEVKVGGRRFQLSAKPFAILEVLMKAPSKVFSRSELIKLVWGTDFAIGHHTLDVHVHAIRQQLNRDPEQLCRLIAIKGVGFKLKSFLPGITAAPVPDALPMAVNSLPLLRSRVACTSSITGSTAQSLPSHRRTMKSRLPRQAHPRPLRSKLLIRQLYSAV
ncbi:MAG: response regulator transcription factor [Nitrospirae bacterium]|nr:response regulator transcription factor [Nitrospirota bacterium]